MATSPTKLKRVAVGVCTRNRPEMLKAVLGSLAAVKTDGLECTFIVVENNDRSTVDSIIADFRLSMLSAKVISEVEPTLGIAPARNRVLEIALTEGADALAFIDDDEVADENWLLALVSAAEKRSLHLLGGPVRLAAIHEGATPSELRVWRGIESRFAAVERKAKRRAESGREDGITIVTNNWLADLDFVRRSGVRFNTAMGFSSGSDSEFYRAMKAAGARTGWAPDAIVHEVWPRERLTVAYQYKRGRDQARSHYRVKFPSLTPRAVAESVAVIAGRSAGAGLLLLKAPFDGGVSLARAARAWGAAVGILGALSGKSSSHYRKTSGN